MIPGDITVLAFGDRRPPRSLAQLPVLRVDGEAGRQAIDEAIDQAVRDARRVVVLGGDAELAAVLTRLMRTERLDVEIAHCDGSVRSRITAYCAKSNAAQRVPLIRDDSGTALVGSAVWLPPNGAEVLRGEAVVDDTVLFDGEVAAVRIEPTATPPGLRASLLGRGRRGWVSGRAAQLGTTGARVIRDGVPGPREVKRSTFYRHTTGWLRVG